MWGLFILGAIGIGAMIHSLKNDTENASSRNNATNSGQKYYTDNYGKVRSVDTNHQVMRYTTAGHKHNWDTVDKDMKTGQILRNYTQEKRDEISNEKRKIHEENLRSKKKAIEEGRYWYSVKEPPIEGYRGGSIAYYSYQRDIMENRLENLFNYEYHKYRISDDLLLDDDSTHYQRIKEFKCQFVVYDPDVEKDGNLKKLNQHIEYNNYNCESSFSQNRCKMTEQEMREYAKKVGAYM